MNIYISHKKSKNFTANDSYPIYMQASEFPICAYKLRIFRYA